MRRLPRCAKFTKRKLSHGKNEGEKRPALLAAKKRTAITEG